VIERYELKNPTDASMDVSDICCGPLFKSNGINAFSYSRLFRDGSRSELWSDGEARDYTFSVARYIVGTYTPKYFASDEQFALLEKKIETYRGSLRERYAAQLNDQKILFGHDNCFAMLIKNGDISEYSLFCGGAGRSEIVNYYLNNLDVLLAFSANFRISAKDLIARADRNRIIPLSTDIVRADGHDNGLPGGTSELTSRERQIAACLVRGMTCKEIGKMLGLSPRTIESHVNNIKRRLDCSKKSALISRLLDKRLGASKGDCFG
jgi:DNA-binding CsgD family transcriptional regulator